MQHSFPLPSPALYVDQIPSPAHRCSCVPRLVPPSSNRLSPLHSWAVLPLPRTPCILQAQDADALRQSAVLMRSLIAGGWEDGGGGSSAPSDSELEAAHLRLWVHEVLRVFHDRWAGRKGGPGRAYKGGMGGRAFGRGGRFGKHR